MSEEMIVRHCSPTLAGIKTGNLFSCFYSSKTQLTREIRILNQKLGPKGLRVLPLRMKEGRALIYLYRPKALAADLADRQAREILEEKEYVPAQADRCIVRLIQRLETQEEFPHEIGLFLSYPPEDVLGFIQNKAENHKCSGCWKVYGDEERAKALFQKYKDCTRAYCLRWQQGQPIEGLAVADQVS